MRNPFGCSRALVAFLAGTLINAAGRTGGVSRAAPGGAATDSGLRAALAEGLERRQLCPDAARDHGLHQREHHLERAARPEIVRRGHVRPAVPGLEGMPDHELDRAGGAELERYRPVVRRDRHVVFLAAVDDDELRTGPDGF